MRWFTRSWHAGELPDADHDAVIADYARHIAELAPSLPPGLRLLSEAGGQVSLHDGWFIDVRWKVGSPEVLLCDVACWDMPGGVLVGNVWTYPALHVRLVYRGARLLQPPPDGGRIVMPRAELLYGEVDRVDGQFEHRVLLWPPEAGSFEVRFDDVDVAIVRFRDAQVTVFFPPT